MADKIDVIEKILVHLKKEGPTNTFRLASVIDLERPKLLNLLKKLEGKQAIRIEHGNAIFVKFTSEEESKPAEIKKSFPEPKKKIKRKSSKSRAVQLLQTANKQLREELVESEEIIKKLRKKVNAPPKVITKTIIRKIPVTKTVIKKILVPLRPPKKNVWEKLKNKSKKIKIPGFKLLENIKQLKKPEFVK